MLTSFSLPREALGHTGWGPASGTCFQRSLPSPFLPLEALLFPLFGPQAYAISYASLCLYLISPHPPVGVLSIRSALTEPLCQTQR